MSEPEICFDHGPGGAPMAFRQPDALIVAESAGEVDAALDAVERAQAAGKWVAGYASYELGYALIPSLAELMPKVRDTPLLMFGVFDEPQGPRRSARGNAVLTPPVPNWDAARYREAFRIVRDYIGAGDTYQVNLTFPLLASLSGEARALYAGLQAHQPVRYGAFVDLGAGPVILSRSPELFFRTDAEGRIETLPMKGTVARGLTEAEDAARKDWLHNDVKNRAENLMIVDLLRNDISRVAKLGSVKVPELFKVQTYTTVHQMVSRVVADLRPGVGIGEIFRALFPCGSITGAPKIRAMEIIRELEPEPRGVYCGAIGWIAPDGASCFNVAIRTLSVFRDGRARLNVGGGVVWDSTAPSEYEEALLKARYARLPP